MALLPEHVNRFPVPLPSLRILSPPENLFLLAELRDLPVGAKRDSKQQAGLKYLMLAPVKNGAEGWIPEVASLVGFPAALLCSLQWRNLLNCCHLASENRKG